MSQSPYRGSAGLDLDTLEQAFVGSDFVPVRSLRPDTLDATKDGEVYATVRVDGNQIHIDEVGKDRKAKARAKRVADVIRAYNGRVQKAYDDAEVRQGGATRRKPSAGVLRRFVEEWRRVGMPGEPRPEPDGTVSVGVERWGRRVFYFPAAAMDVLRHFPDAEEADDEVEEQIAAVLDEEFSRAVARSEPLERGRATTRKAPRTATGVQMRSVDENLWRATVFHRGSMYVCDYAPTDAKDGGDPETGAPTEALVREDWKHDRGAFRLV
jgi:hypothetical protein